MNKLKVLLPTTGLDIGGAETHVTELAKQLKEMGHQPIVMSSGGIYVDELQNYDIEHVQSPLNSKSPKDMLVSIKCFYDTVKQYRPHIIHTHGRIAALISRLISARLKVPFMTTSHALFTYRWPLKHLTFWGDEVIAISDDVKQHLINRFDVKKDKITVIPNGINMKRFSPDIEDNNIMTELSLREKSKKVVYVSRLDGPLAELAARVVEITPRLQEAFNDIEVIIVGDGEGLNKIKELASKIDNSHDIVKITGKRTDIHNILNIADAVIAVGRTAIEAMAIEKTVIIAGGEGYMGILSEQNFELALGTNFTGRGINTIESSHQLSQDIINLLQLPKEEIINRGKFFRDKVHQIYSVEETTRQTIEVYYKLLRGDSK